MQPITYQLTERDIIGGNNLWRRSRLKVWEPFVAFAGLSAVILGIMLLRDAPITPVSVALIAGGAMIAQVLIFLRRRISSTWTAAKHFRQSTAMQQEVEVSWTDTHLSLTQPNAHQTRTWSDIKSWAEDDGVIVLFEAGPIFVPIPKRALTTVLLSEMRDSLSQAGVPKARLFLL